MKIGRHDRSTMLPDLAGRFHTFEQRGEVAALDPDELDAPGRLEQAWIERADLHIAEIDQRLTASATVLALAIEARDDPLIAARPKRAKPCDAKTSCDGHSKAS